MMSWSCIIARPMLAILGLCSLSSWRADDWIGSFPESGIVALIVGLCIMSTGIAYGLSLFMRSAIALGLIDFCLRSSGQWLSGEYDSLIIPFIVTSFATAAVLTFAWSLDLKNFRRRWDAPIFFILAGLAIALGTRDAMGSSSNPYVVANIGLWVAVVFAGVAGMMVHSRSKPVSGVVSSR